MSDLNVNYKTRQVLEENTGENKLMLDKEILGITSKHTQKRT